jgi:hypothetical protein
MSKGGDRGGRRPRSPAATLRKIEALAASIQARPEQLTEWTETELSGVVSALSKAGFAFEDVLARRWHEEGLRDD